MTELKKKYSDFVVRSCACNSTQSFEIMYFMRSINWLFFKIVW